MAPRDPLRPNSFDRVQRYRREILMAAALTLAALTILLVTFSG